MPNMLLVFPLAPPRRGTKTARDWSGPLKAGSELAAEFSLAIRAAATRVGDMSQAAGDARGNAGGEGTAAAAPFTFSPEPTLEDIRRLHAEFAAERDWGQFHQPRNLLLALVGEVGELAELFQWKPDEEPGPQAWPPRERTALQEELSDVLIYLVALAARCHVDLPQAVLSKMDTNRRRYPAHLSRGSACKYTDLPHGAASKDQAVGPAEFVPESMGQAST